MPYIINLAAGQIGHGLNLVSNISSTDIEGSKHGDSKSFIISPLKNMICTLDESVRGVSPIIDGVQASLNTSTSDGSSSQEVVRTLIIGGVLPQFNGNGKCA